MYPRMLQIGLPFILFLCFGSTQSADCALDCVANVNGTSCGKSQWTCLCQSDLYLTNLNTCASKACNETGCGTTISAVAEICAVFNSTPTINPYATATTGTEAPLLSTLALPSVTLPSTTASTSSIDSIAGTSIFTTTNSGAATGSGVAATTSTTPTNFAQRLDLRTMALQGVTVALLGLAVYL